MKLDIYLRGGQTITLDVTDWKLDKNKVTAELVLLEVTHAGEARLPFIKLSDVSAIVRRDS